MSNEITSMNNGNNSCGLSNTPGIKKIEYVPISWIKKWPEYIGVNNTITTAIELITGKSWLLGLFIPSTAKYNEKSKASKKGNRTTISIEAGIALDTESISNLFNNMEHELFILKITDKNNRIRIAGNPKAPLKFSSNLSSGKKSGDDKGYSYMFYGDVFDKSPFYSV